MKTGILVHGPHVQAKGWMNLAWGTAPDQMGRLPKAIQMYLRLGAEVIYFGTGASERDGIKEAQWMFDTLYTKKSELSNFDALSDLKQQGIDIHLTPDGPVIYAGRTQAKCIIDLTPQNTIEELLRAGDAFLTNGVGQVVLVSSATHMSRCLRDEQIVYNDPKHGGKYKRLAQNLLVAPADTCYEGAGYDSTVIFEHPHRGDRPDFPFHETARLLFKVGASRQTEFDAFLRKVIGNFAEPVKT
jgi:hypothetical protein